MQVAAPGRLRDKQPKVSARKRRVLSSLHGSGTTPHQRRTSFRRLSTAYQPSNASDEPRAPGPTLRLGTATQGEGHIGENQDYVHAQSRRQRRQRTLSETSSRAVMFTLSTTSAWVRIRPPDSTRVRPRRLRSARRLHVNYSDRLWWRRFCARREHNQDSPQNETLVLCGH